MARVTAFGRSIMTSPDLQNLIVLRCHSMILELRYILLLALTWQSTHEQSPVMTGIRFSSHSPSTRSAFVLGIVDIPNILAILWTLQTLILRLFDKFLYNILTTHNTPAVSFPWWSHQDPLRSHVEHAQTINILQMTHHGAASFGPMV